MLIAIRYFTVLQDISLRFQNVPEFFKLYDPRDMSNQDMYMHITFESDGNKYHQATPINLAINQQHQQKRNVYLTKINYLSKNAIFSFVQS